MDPQRNDLFTLDDDDSRNALDSYSRIEQNLEAKNNELIMAESNDIKDMEE